MPNPIRDSLQANRINRMKTRVHRWWHANRCPACAAGREQAGKPAIVQLMTRLGLSTDDEPEAGVEWTAAKHQH